MKKRNSLIELYRFIFAMNVVKNHGFFPYQGKLFSPEHVSVEFFFTLSGFLLRRTFEKYLNLSYFKGLFLMLKNKIIAMGIPFLVALLIHIPYRIVTKSTPWWDLTDWGYLWYVFDMLVIDIFYFTIRRLTNSDVCLFIVAGVLFITASVFHVIPQFHDTGWFRAISAMSLGVLISYIPPIKMKNQWLLLIPLVAVWGYVLRILFSEYSFIEEEILNLVAFPALIYLTFQLPVQNRVLNYLGAISFGLYAYQAVPRLIRVLGYDNTWLSFAIIVVLAVSTDLIIRLIRNHRFNSNNSQNTNVYEP